MYLSHFGLNQSPFNITPNPAFFYAGSKRGDILEALIYAVTHGEGIVKVTGEVGSGKTMLCRMLESMLPSNIEVIYLVNPTLSREEVMYAIAGELDLAIGGKRPDEVIRLLQNDLIAKHIKGKQVVLLIEEAQAMPLETLEEIRLFSNLETAHHKLLQIVLFGQPELDESLGLPRMRQLRERITHSFKVPPLTPELIPEYLMFRMRAAGYHGPDIFSKGAIKRIATVSDGIIRRISILADKSLLAAFADNTHTIRTKHVKDAIRDSEFSDSAAASQHRLITITAMLSIGLLVAFGVAWTLFVQNKEVTPPTSVPRVAAPAPAAPKPPTQPSSPTSAPVPAQTATTAALPTTREAETVKLVPAAPSSATIITAVSEQKKPGTEPSSSPMPNADQDLAQAKPPLSILQQRLALSQTWLATQPPKNFSVQLMFMAIDNRAEIERFLQKRQTEIGTDKIFIYPSRIGAISRYGVVYGSFSTRAEVVAQIAKLADDWDLHGQLRTIGGIRDEIRRSKSEDLWPN